MSDYTAIRAISESLQALLNAEITEPGVNAHLLSPQEMREDETSGVSVWLYRVARNEHLYNQRPTRPAPNLVGRKPLFVNLFYLITPLLPDPLDEQQILGRVLQVFHDYPVLRGANLVGSLAGSDEEFHIHLQTPTHEELTRVWDALDASYQASLSYMVQAVNIEPQIPPVVAPPVATREMGYSQILEVD